MGRSGIYGDYLNANARLNSCTVTQKDGEEQTNVRRRSHPDRGHSVDPRDDHGWPYERCKALICVLGNRSNRTDTVTARICV